MPKRKLFYGWIIVAANVVMMIVSIGMINNCMSLYIVPICGDLGITRAAGSVISSVVSAGGVLVTALSARIYRRFRISHTMRFGAILLACAYASFSFAKSSWMLYASALFVSVANALVGYVPEAILLTNWFERRTGFVVGLAYMGSGVGGMIFSPVIGNLIDAYGWRMTFVILGCVIAVFAIPASFLLRDKPADMGLLPYGHDPRLGAAPLGREMFSGTPYDKALRSIPFWVLVLGIALTAVTTSGTSAMFAAHLSDVGYPITVAATIISVSSGSLILGKAVLGYLYDHLHMTVVTMIAGVFLLAGMIAYVVLPGIVPIIMIILSFSIGFALPTVAAPVLTRTVFGMRDFSRLSALVITFMNLISAAGSLIGGAVHDLSGSYVPAFVLFAVLVVITQVSMAIFLKPYREEGKTL